jgi:multidrug efflux pump subunit AcrA (membrane-fusion protein)
MLLSGLFWIRFDVVIEATGIVEPKTLVRLHAPREARLDEVLVTPGQTVRKGDPLMRLRDESLEREIHQVRQDIAATRLEASLALGRERELALTGGGPEIRAAAESAVLSREKEKILAEIAGIYESLVDAGAVSRMERLTLAARRLDARGEALRNETLVKLEEEGLNGLRRERESLLAAAAEQKAARLEARLDALAKEAAGLLVSAPIAGRVTDVFARDAGLWLDAGQALLSVAAPEDGYVARMFVADRNVDLLRPGLPVRMESMVFAATSEGYLHGRVLSAIADAASADAGGFEVLAAIERWPVEPVIGSRVKAEILLRRQGFASLVGHRPLREGGRHGP